MDIFPTAIDGCVLAKGVLRGIIAPAVGTGRVGLDNSTLCTGVPTFDGLFCAVGNGNSMRFCPTGLALAAIVQIPGS